MPDPLPVMGVELPPSSYSVRHRARPALYQGPVTLVWLVWCCLDCISDVADEAKLHFLQTIWKKERHHAAENAVQRCNGARSGEPSTISTRSEKLSPRCNPLSSRRGSHERLVHAHRTGWLHSEGTIYITGLQFVWSALDAFRNGGSMNWLSEKARCLTKRLFFNYETALVGEFCCAAAMQFYLTLLNRSSLKHSQPAAEAVSYYVWSLVGHGVIVLGIVATILSIRATGVIISVKCSFGSLKLFTSPCSVDTALGVRSKMILLSGYVWENGTLCYRVETLKSFGIMSMGQEDDTQFLVLHKLRWLAIPRQDMIAIGEVDGNRVQPCIERPCAGIVSAFGTPLGGPTDASISAKRVWDPARRSDGCIDIGETSVCSPNA